MKAQSAVPILQASDLDVALRYYKEALGFTEDFRFNDYAGVRHGEACLHLCGHNLHRRPVGGGTVAIFCDEVDDYFAEISRKGANVKVPPADRPYGMRDFTVLDPDGNHLNFGCEIGKPAA